jgi:basic membrane protein A
LLPLAALALVAAAAFAVLGGAGSAAPKATFKAALVSDVGRFNDKGFNQNQLTGLNLAKAKLHVQVRGVESHAASDYIPNLAAMARQGNNIVISAGFLLADAMNTVAAKFPNTKFAITDDPVNGPPFSGKTPGPSKLKNVEGLTYASQENSYLVGCLAALMAKKGGGNMISVVGGVKIPPVDTFIAGYQAGANKCVPGTVVKIDYSQDFIAQDKCKELALNQIAAGSKVVFNVAGPCGLGTLSAAKDKGVWGIGVDVDQSYLGSHILTSAVKRVDTGVYLAIKGAMSGSFKSGGNLVFNLKNAGVGLGKMSSQVPAAYVTQLNGLKKQIIAGTIKPPTVVKGG